MAIRPEPLPKNPLPLELHNGDVMTREEFHRAYEDYPDHVKFELINGIVHTASPTQYVHGDSDFHLTTLLGIYKSQTPGTHGVSNSTVELSDEDEPQPDIFLRIEAEFGGRSTRTAGRHIAGPPELVIEISNSTLRLDLNEKRDSYSRNGILEYLVFDVQGECLHWFDLATGQELTPDADGVYRLKQFPGLWIDGPAVIREDLAKANETVYAGLASLEHTAFVEELSRRRNTPPAS